MGISVTNSNTKNKNKNIFTWQLQASSPIGNAAKGEFSTVINFKKVISSIKKHLNNSPFEIGIADNIGYFTASEGYLRKNNSAKAGFQGCCASLTNIGIDSVGNVRGCESIYDDIFIEGNLRSKSLYDILNDPDAFAYNRKFTLDLLTGKCQECKYGSRCAGGCRSYNYFTHKKMYDS